MARKHEPSRATELVQEAIDKTGQAIAQVEGILRDLPEPKEEPEVIAIQRQPEHMFSVIHPKTMCVLESGARYEFMVTYLGRDGQPASQGFALVASKGSVTPEVRVIGASNVTIG